jgi:hypothetical protein
MGIQGAKMNKGDWIVGTQIARIPNHLMAGNVATVDDLNQDGLEFGFITSMARDGQHAFCRYWVKGQAGMELRTKSNAELTNLDNLVEYQSCLWEEVKQAMEEYCGLFAQTF